MRDVEAGRLETNRFGQINAALSVFVEAMNEATADEPGTAPRTNGVSTDPDAVIDARLPDRPVILCIAAKNKLDESAASMLTQLLEAHGLRARVATATQLGRTAGPDLSGVQIVCICAFDAGERSAHVKFLLRRLRRQLPAARFLGCFWRLEANNPAHSIVIGSIGADEVVSTLAAAVDRCILHQHGATLETAPELPVSEPPPHPSVNAGS